MPPILQHYDDVTIIGRLYDDPIVIKMWWLYDLYRFFRYVPRETLKTILINVIIARNKSTQSKFSQPHFSTVSHSCQQFFTIKCFYTPPYNIVFKLSPTVISKSYGTVDHCSKLWHTLSIVQVTPLLLSVGCTQVSSTVVLWDQHALMHAPTGWLKVTVGI